MNVSVDNKVPNDKNRLVSKAVYDLGWIGDVQCQLGCQNGSSALRLFKIVRTQRAKSGRIVSFFYFTSSALFTSLTRHMTWVPSFTPKIFLISFGMVIRPPAITSAKKGMSSSST